ncbi:GAF domain-containing protein [Daejeonella oryzae]|uniref:GAF domain-containing protein n=1 Tax=Daejeonella oryzae TaxID=1122943 RepID=UPI000418B9C0|nr:GAF domain-containing protein [Daejeonella oryzae]
MNSRTNYDSDFCGSLPLHLINTIQPYGYVIVLNKSDLSVIQASDNVANLWDCSVKSILNHSFLSFLDNQQEPEFKEKAATNLQDRIPLTLRVEVNKISRELLTIIHQKEELIILEMELLNDEIKNSFVKVYQDLRYSVNAIEKGTSLDSVCKAAINELKKISGFDRVMMYQFDEDWNGTVIAEDIDESLYESYLGLKFPASDIPKQARALYLKNAYRLIPDRDYKPVGFYPVINPLTQTFLDLSDCNLRGVPKVHLEYLKNMDVKASMSIRVIKDEKLWGLISCHSKTEKSLNYEICSIFELLSNIISNKITAILNKETYLLSNKLNEARARIIDQIYTEDDILKGLISSENHILNILNSEGAAVLYDGRVETVGNVPNKEFIENLSYWLDAKNTNTVYHENNLANVYDQAGDEQHVASGILVIPINQSKSEYIIGFRPEFVKTIKWGGNPNEAINFEEDNKTYHPRNSFKLWKETVKQTSQPWYPAEIAVSESFRSFLYEFATR